MASDDLTGRVPDAGELADRLAILDVLGRHSRGVDRADAAVLKSAYWPDATVAYGRFNGPAHDFCEHLPTAIRHYARTHHCISNTVVETRGDEARVETYVTAYHLTAGGDGGEARDMTYYGRYLDRFERRDGYWKIRHRQVVMDWHRDEPAAVDFDDPRFEGLGRGGRHPEDPVYALLAD